MAALPFSASATVDGGGIVGRYLSLPDTANQRQAEGGRRLSGSSKSSQPDLPLVTIITVCRNAAATLAQCIDSVISQTYSNIEYIVIDGCSSDDTLALIGKYSVAIDYFVSEPDRGLYHAMNKRLHSFSQCG
jgi:cellulose synthase/poly-beta-1,6-N-acetylglucosamine synthase-like glycosyltransferase